MRLAPCGQTCETAAMPQRPSKKVKTQPATKPGAVKDGGRSDHGSQQRRGDDAARAILAKFQGKKSI